MGGWVGGVAVAIHTLLSRRRPRRGRPTMQRGAQLRAAAGGPVKAPIVRPHAPDAMAFIFM